MPLAAAFIDREIIMRCDIRQKEKNKYLKVPLAGGMQKFIQMH